MSFEVPIWHLKNLIFCQSTTATLALAVPPTTSPHYLTHSLTLTSLPKSFVLIRVHSWLIKFKFLIQFFVRELFRILAAVIGNNVTATD